MKAVILSGGLGTRISEETHLKPKPMIEIGGKPILWHLMKIYSSYGVNDFIICCGYKGYIIKEYFANYFLHMSDVTFDMKNNEMKVHQQNAEPWTVTLVDTGEDTQTGGRLKRVLPYLKNEKAFCFTYGDGLSNVNISELIKFHEAHGKLATVTAVQPPGRYGALNRNDDQVLGFIEKPKGDGGWINGGFFVLNPKVIDFIEGDDTAWEQKPLELIAGQGDLMAYEHTQFWQPMDTLREKNLLEELWEKKYRTLESLEITLNFWEGKKVFLTGHTGFKGSWLSLWLQSLGAEVTGYALTPPTTPNLFNVAKIAEGMRSVIGDIRDLDQLKKAVKETNPEIVIHMAAQPLVRYSYANPVETYATNVMGTVHILEATRESKNIKAILNVTSDKCYENREIDHGYKENEPMGGYDPYSNSKGCAELVTSAYRNSFFNPEKYHEHGVALATARAGNVIGGGDWAEDRLIPDFMRAIVKKQKVFIRNPYAVRPWQHVLEPLKGYLMLCQKLYDEGASFSESFNFGPHESDAKNVEWIVEHLVSFWGESVQYEITSNASQFHEAHFLKLDCAKARAQLAWQPLWNIEEALQRICAWHKAHLNGEDMYTYSLNDIKIHKLQ